MSDSNSLSVDQSIRTQLLSLQSSFFQSLQLGTDSLVAFHHKMTSFNETISQSEQHFGEETRSLIYSFAQMTTAIIPALIDVDITSEKISQEQTEEINKLLHELSLGDTAYTDTQPPYIQPAHAWLLNNLHNPYPSKETRKILSEQTDTPQKDIDSWFTDVRRRIGWNSLRNKHFSTRKDVIAAATRFFKPSSRQLDSRTELEDTTHFDQEFALLEDAAKNLYSKRFSTTTFADRLVARKDLTTETSSVEQGNSSARQISSQEIECIPESPYPSPGFVSPFPLTFSSPSPTISPPLQLSSQSRKRRQSSSDPPSSHEGQPFKRARIDFSADAATHSPSPPVQSSARQHLPFPLNSSPRTIPAISTSISDSSRKRKRRSSDSDSEDDQGRMKRTHCTPRHPSNHLVEPLPAGSSNLDDLEHWLKSLGSEGLDLSHSIPEPIFETPPLSASVEIDLYCYTSSSPSTSVASLGPSTPPDYNSLDSPTTSHQSLSWLEPPPSTKAQGYDSLADVTSEFLSTLSTESFSFDLSSASNADFSSQNWDLGLTPAMSANNYPISQVLQESGDNSTQPWTNSEPGVPISMPRQPNQLSSSAPLSDIVGGTSVPQVSQHPSVDKKGAKMRYLQTLLNEVQNVRFELAI